MTPRFVFRWCSVLCVATGCSGDQPAGSSYVAPSPAARTAPEEQSQVDWQSLAVAEEKSAQVSPEAATTLALDDGTKVVLPVGAVKHPGKLTLKRVIDPGPTAPYNTLTLVEIDGGNADLTAEAELVLPCPPFRPKSKGIELKYEVLHHHGANVEPLPATYDPQSHTVSLRTKRFSGLEVIAVVSAIVGATRALVDADFGRGGVEFPEPERAAGDLLYVPYYPQGGLQWCWAASIEMVLKAAGNDVELWQLGRAVQAGPDDGVSPLAAARGIYSQAATSLGGKLDMCRLPWRDRTAMVSYVLEMLRKKTPVMLCLANARHVVVAVGYDREGLYVHDPSGQLLTNLQPHWAEAAKLDQANRLAAVKIPWEVVDAFLQTQYFTLNTNYTATAGPVVGAFPAAVALDPLPSGQVEGNMAQLSAVRRFGDIGAPARSELSIGFACDGRQEKGYHYKFDKQLESGIYKFLPELMPEHFTRSDELILKLHGAYSAPGAITMKVTSELAASGETPLRAEATHQFRGSAAPYVVDQSIQLFNKQKLQDGRRPAGELTLTVKAEVNGDRVDGLTVVVPMGPSTVRNLHVRPADRGRANLSWDSVPEPDVEYLVYRVSNIQGSYYMNLVETTTTTSVATKPSANPTEREYYCVQARHVPSKLTGYVSEFVSSTPEKLQIAQSKLCENPPDWAPDEMIPEINALLAAGDETATLLGGKKYQWGRESCPPGFSDALQKVPELVHPTSKWPFYHISSLTWLDEQQTRKGWWLTVVTFNKESQCDLMMSKDPPLIGGLKAGGLQVKEAGGVTTHRPPLPAPPPGIDPASADFNNALNAALAGNVLHGAALTWRSGRRVFFLERIIFDVSGPGGPAKAYNDAYRTGESIIGIVTSKFASVSAR